jgi:hypothetical protein
MAIDITRIIVKHLNGRRPDSIPMCVNWLYEQIGGKRKPEAPQEGRWCGRGWVIHEHEGRFYLECIESASEQRFSLIWL